MPKAIYLGLKSIIKDSNDLALWIIEKIDLILTLKILAKLPENYLKLPLLEPLVKVGLFDSFEKNRQKKYYNLKLIYEFVWESWGLFGEMLFIVGRNRKIGRNKKNYMEHKLLGGYVSKHPLQAIASKGLFTRLPIGNLSENSYAIILVEVFKIKIWFVQKGENMAPSYTDDSKRKNWITLLSDLYRQVGQEIKKREPSTIKKEKYNHVMAVCKWLHKK